MKQSTFSAQVANNLLTLLQGYTKTIRLLLVMFLTLTVSAEVWADYTIAFKSTTGADGNTAQTTIDNLISSGGTNVSTISATRAYNGKSGYGIKLGSSSSTGNVIMTLANSAQIKASKLVVKAACFDSDKTLKVTVTYTDNNTTTQTLTPASSPTDYDVSLTDTKTIKQIKIESVTDSKGRMYCHSIKVVAASAAPSYTITATSNNDTYGTVSLSGTTITASPKTGYTYANPAYTVTAGTASVAQSGNTFTVTPSSDCSIQINFAEKVKNTYIDNVQGNSIQTLYDTHAAPSLTDKTQATTGTCEQQHWHFMGWVTEANKENPTDANIVKANTSVTANATTYYAVWAKGTTTGGGSTSKQYSFDITKGDFNTTSYTANNNSKTSTAKASDNSTKPVSWTSYQVMQQSSAMQWQSSKGYIYNTTDLGNITNVTITSTAGTFTTYYGTSQQPSQNTSVGTGNGYFQIKVGSATGKVSNIKVTFTQTVEGETTTTYSDYITTCITQPSYSVTSNLSHVTAGVGNSTTITSEDTELKLRYSAQDGWNLPDAIAVTMGGTPLSNDDYVWDKDNGDLLIGGNFGFAFTGDIVVTINGRQQLATPTGLSATNITSSSATLSWNAVANASSYTVSVYGENDKVIAEYSELTENTKTVSELDPKTNYIFGVVAVGDGITYTNSSQATSDVFTTKAATYTITYVTNGGTEIESTSGTALPNPLPETTRAHYTFAGWYMDETFQTQATAGATINANTTLYAKWTPIEYTVTFNAGSGTCATEPTQGNFETGITLPTATPSTTCQSEGWTFVGWWTEAVTETTTSPGELLTADSNYKPASNCTLYAVYSITDSNGGGGSSEITLLPSSFPDKGSNAYGSGAERVATENGIEFGGHHITGNPENTPSGAKQNQYLQCRASDATIYNKTELPGNITKIVVNQNDAKAFSLYCGSKQLMASDNVDRLQTPSGEKMDDVTEAATMTWNVSGNYTFFALKKGSNASYVTSIVITYSGGNSTTTYNSNPVCVASYSITYDFAGGTSSHCSNTSVPQGDQYIICDEEPTKEGYTFLHWSDGVNTYNPSDVIKNVTADITLTAVWQINTYTVTWSNNGTPTPVVYNHGDALVVPDAPASCDGVKEFVGWTTHSSYYHATTAPDDIFTTKTTPVTATATYYAVFATKGEGSANFVLGESGTFKMYANVNGTNYYAQGGVSSSKITSTTEAANASDYTLTYADGVYTIKQGTSNVGNKTNNADLNTTETTWTISEGTNGSWRVTSNVSTSRALSYSTSASAFKAYSISNITDSPTSYYDIEFGGTSSGYSDYTTICQQIESIEVQNNPQTEFYLTDNFTIGSGKVIATLSGGGTTDVTALATFSGYNMNVVGTYTVTVTYMGATATYEIYVKPLDNAWVLTWNVSGKTNTGLGPRSVTKGNAIGTLPTPEVPAACAGKTFMGWTTSNIVHSDGTGITYITPATVPTDNTTYYAVFATINNFCSQKPIDQITNGSKVVIVAVASLTDNGGAGKAISSRATDDTHNLQGDDVAIYDQTINTPHSTCIWTITKSGEKYIFTQDGKYLNGIIDGRYSNLKYDGTSDEWTLTPAASGMARTYNMESTNASGEYIEWYNEKFTIHNDVNNNGAFDMQFFVTANAAGNADTTDYTTGCAEYTITYYGFRGGYSTSCSSDGTIVLPVNSIHTIPNCEGLVINDHTNLGRTFTGVWMTKPHGGHTFKPGDTFILTQDTTLYAQWKMETTSDVTTLPTDIEDLAGTDIYVYGGKTLTLQPGTTTINSLTLKGGIQKDGSYKMPTVWVPEGATLIRKSNKIYLDLVVNAQTYYPFAVPFAAKNNANVEYLDPGLAAASTYGKHFVIKTYDGANRAKVGEDKTNNWVSVRRDSTLQPGVGYIITALTRSTKDTATIRIPMTVPDTWFNNGEQAAVGTTVRNTIAVTAHDGAAATKHQRHAGWNFVANPYLTNFTGGNVANDGDLAYINGELIIEGSYEYGGDPVPYVTIPAYNFASYSQHKLSDVKLSPEWSFFVQVGTGGTMNFTTAGRQQAPASIAARNAEERPVKMDVDLILSDNHSSDQTGIIICDRYTDAYEIGHDLEKLFGSAYNLSVYTLMADNTPLAFQALAIRSSMQVIPVGYRAPEQGEYTFRLNEATSSIDLLNEQYEQLVLVDYQTGELTNLLYTDYTFYSERTQSNARFAIYAVPRQNAPTDLPNAISQDKQAQKILHNGHLYILRDGNVYNGNGQIVK